MIKRLIPCLDLFNGRIIKGINFNNLIDIGDPVDVASYYNDEGADELVILDITASLENKTQMFSYIGKISSRISIPLTVGGGVKSLNDFKNLFNCGADKISLNSSVLENFNIIKEIKYKYGKQCLVVALDVKKYYLNDNFYYWNIYKKSGKINSNFNLFDILIKFQKTGIGELLLTSIDKDGTKSGYDLELINKINSFLKVNIIVSGGGGDLFSLLNIFKIKNIDAILVASILHNKKYTIFFIKNFLFNNGIFFKF
ncbi:imidazole glycerol phosphate synthase subunit HisF [Candidatus Nasuia deltocephalinicola]|uniref:imidazole glycerol phosphate synthase subunit HisF n=1 Tax=Candidatus Nasuia deltocephalincola TaxID=1160784 RepID=UPI00216AEB4E|nr:imidazole glycerol phosphate synthase cyclase subunit [Candidatus Nasuia deltocephalinicola]